MVLATVEHHLHGAPRGTYDSHDQETYPAVTTFFTLDDESVPVTGLRPTGLVQQRGPAEKPPRSTGSCSIEAFVPVQILDAPVPQLGKEVVEVPKIESHALFSAAFLEWCRADLQSSFPGQGSFRQGFVEQNIKVFEVHAQDRVLQRFVEQNITFVTVFSRDRVQQLLVELIISVSSWSRVHQRVVEHIILVNKVFSLDKVQLRFVAQVSSVVDVGEVLVECR